MSEKFVETFRGAIYPWHCDHLGHMNVQFYVAMFDQASVHIFSHAGLRWLGEDGKRYSFADVKHEIDYKAELPVGSPVIVKSAFLKIGNKSVKLLHRMYNVETDVLAATSKVTCVRFDLQERKAVELPDALRKGMEALLVDEDSV